MSEASTELSDASLTRIEAAQPAADYGHLAAQGHAYVIVLRITDFYVSAYNLLAPARVSILWSAVRLSIPRPMNAGLPRTGAIAATMATRRLLQKTKASFSSRA